MVIITGYQVLFGPCTKIVLKVGRIFLVFHKLKSFEKCWSEAVNLGGRVFHKQNHWSLDSFWSSFHKRTIKTCRMLKLSSYESLYLWLFHKLKPRSDWGCFIVSQEDHRSLKKESSSELSAKDWDESIVFWCLKIHGTWQALRSLVAAPYH